jgi:alpha-aminoadipate/glutamate carrier protein LysW
MSECPVCGAEVEIAADVIAGELMVCGDCGVELELLETDPVKLAEAPSAEEDWGQ